MRPIHPLVLTTAVLLTGCPDKPVPTTEDDPVLSRVLRGVSGGPGMSKPEQVGTHEGRQIMLLVQRDGDRPRTDDMTLDFDVSARLGVAISHDGLWYTDLPGLRVDGQDVEADLIRPLSALEGFENVWWFKVEAEQSSYRNSNDNPGWWADIRYVETLDTVTDDGTREVDVQPLRHAGVQIDGRHVGTMRFKASVELSDVFLSTPGADALSKGGALPGVLRISRKGNTGNRIVDHGLSLANLPYIWGSATIEGKSVQSSHQSEQHIGSDCADMLVAAWRLSGSSTMDYSAVVPMVRQYASSGRGIEVTDARKSLLLDAGGKQISMGVDGAEIGAGVMWRFGPGKRKGHAGILVEDSGPDGKPNHLLDEHDLVLHTMWNTPELEPLGDVLTGLTPVAVINPISSRTGERWIEIDLGRQKLRTMHDDRQVHEFAISSGKKDKTPTGTFRIWRKNRVKDMKVGLMVLGDYFVLSDVPFIQYFEGESLPRGRGFAIHGAYWHGDFGKPVTHGCINMRQEDARKLFFWTGPVIGSDEEVVAHDSNPGTRVIIFGTPPKSS